MVSLGIGWGTGITKISFGSYYFLHSFFLCFLYFWHQLIKLENLWAWEEIVFNSFVNDLYLMPFTYLIVLEVTLYLLFLLNLLYIFVLSLQRDFKPWRHPSEALWCLEECPSCSKRAYGMSLWEQNSVTASSFLPILPGILVKKKKLFFNLLLKTIFLEQF